MALWKGQVTDLTAADVAAHARPLRKESASVGAADDATALDLSGLALPRLTGALASASNLRSLTLACNALTALAGMPALPALTLLDVSFNDLRTLFPLPCLPALRELNAMCNRVAPVDDVAMLRKQALNITALDLRMNPIAAAKQYPGVALRRLRHLARLDGADVTAAARAAARASGANLDDGALLAACTFARRSEGERQDVVEEPEASASRLASAVAVVIESRHLRRLDFAARLAGVVDASFADNELPSCAGIEALSRLTSLDVSVRSLLPRAATCAAARLGLHAGLAMTA